MASWSNGAGYCVFAPIPDESSDYYGVSMALINLLAMTYFIAYIPTAPLSSWFLGKSLYWSMMIINITLFVGSWVRVLAFDMYGVVLLG
jgi:hypothetical protein